MRNFDFNPNHPYVTVVAAYAKNRREDSLPLRRETADMLAEHCQGKGADEYLFDMKTINGTECLREDLEHAGIAVQDESGLVVDFLSLRHTFITRLAE